MKNNLIIQAAQKTDMPRIVSLFGDDILGKTREELTDNIPQSYYDAFETINNDANNILIVALLNEKIVGTLQLIFITNMSFQGAKRAIIEGVHVDKECRSNGIGKDMMEWAIEQAKLKNCRFVQLTSNKLRKDAHRFYENLGFTASHEGFKLDLGNN